MDAAMLSRITTLVQSLGLSRPAIGLAFVDEPPASVGRPDGVVPSACTFWRMAEREVFYAAEEEHFNCPTGVMTMGFQVPGERREEAEAIINTRCELEYFDPEEASALPSVSGARKGIVYGPLARMPVDAAPG